MTTPRKRPPAPGFGELILLGLVGPVAGSLFTVPLLLFLVPTPGRPDNIWVIAVVLGLSLFFEVVAGPAVAGWLALRRERCRGGPGSRRTFLEGSLAGLAWVLVAAVVMKQLALIG